jgi:hypothetical protein
MSQQNEQVPCAVDHRNGGLESVAGALLERSFRDELCG